MEASGRPWVIILAGGEGTRIAHLTAGPSRRAVPKQFWRFCGDRSLLCRTLDRAGRIAPPQRIVAVVAEAHRHWWESELGRLAPENILAQSANRGTAVGILNGLGHVLLRDRAPIVAVMPSDHEVEEEGVLLRAIAEAVETARGWPDRVVLLGMTPDGPDPEYGWIVPGQPAGGLTRPVRAFFEKPSPPLARRLFEQGAVWNSFILATAGWTLLRLYERAQPDLLAAYVAPLARARWRSQAVADYDGGLPERDFGRDLLQGITDRLRVLTVAPCGWIDMGTPARVASWLARQGSAVPDAGRVAASSPSPAA